MPGSGIVNLEAGVHALQTPTNDIAANTKRVRVRISVPGFQKTRPIVSTTEERMPEKSQQTTSTERSSEKTMTEQIDLKKLTFEELCKLQLKGMTAALNAVKPK